MTIKLLHKYFKDSRKRGELIRIVYNFYEVDCEEDMKSFDTFYSTDQDQLPFGYYPTLTVDGQEFGETRAILRYFAELKGGIPDNGPLANLFINQWEQNLLAEYDLITEPYIPSFIDTYVKKEMYDEDKHKFEAGEEAWKKFHYRLAIWEKQVKSNKNYVTENGKDGYLEVLMFAVLENVEYCFPKTLNLKQYPSLTALCDRVKELPTLKNYLENRPMAYI